MRVLLLGPSLVQRNIAAAALIRRELLRISDLVNCRRSLKGHLYRKKVCVRVRVRVRVRVKSQGHHALTFFSYRTMV